MKKKSVVSIGMFDLFKGITMIMIVLGHTIDLYSFDFETNPNPLVGVLFATLSVIGRPILFIISGYGFRKEKIGKCIRQQCQYMLKPYLYTMLGTLVLHFITRIYVCGSAFVSLKETAKLGIGFLMALPENHVIAGHTIFSCGPMWYIIALFFAWIIYDFLAEKLPEKYIWPVAGLLTVVGCTLERFSLNYFCIAQALCAVLYIHIGYRMKKRKILHKEIGFKQVALGALATFLVPVWFQLTDQMDESLDIVGNCDPIITIYSGFIGCLFLIALLQINKLDIKANKVLRTIGNYSLYIFCAHTVDMHGFPWYMFAERLGNQSGYVMLANFALRSAFIALVTLVCVKRTIIVKAVTKAFAKGKENA